MFGTFDSKYFQWNETAFARDYRDLIVSFMELETKPDVYVLVPPPLYKMGLLKLD